MIHEIRVPELGESVREGTIVAWLHEDGAIVPAGAPLLELETDKVTMEVVSTAPGRLKIEAAAGETVAVGALVATIDDSVAVGEERAPAASPARDDGPPIVQTAGVPQAAAKLAGETGPDLPLSPAVRRLVAEQRLDPAAIPATGPGGRLTKEDVVVHLERRDEPPPAAPQPPRSAQGATPPPAAPPAERQTRTKMSRIRQRIAERLVRSKSESAILTTFNEADMSRVIALRAAHKEAFQKKHGVGLGFMSFFVKASVEALRAVPELNAQIDGDEIVRNHYYDIGVAVGTEQGLVVPVVRGCDALSFAGIEAAIADFARRARDRTISLDELQGGVFTISNGGVYGSLLSTPILNPPQSGILGLHAIKKRPVAVGDEVVVRPMMYLALSYDHRIVDGKEAVTFLRRVVDCIESPERTMLEV